MVNTHSLSQRQNDQIVEEEDVELGLDSVFLEAPRPPSPQATFSTYQAAHKSFRIQLVGSHPLWGHHLWNSAISVASYLERHQSLCYNKNVLELGAGGALPGLIAVESGLARKVVITDYPDPDLIQNIELNVQENVDDSRKDKVAIQGYIWGQPIHPLLEVLQDQDETASKFDLIILSDLIFNHSQHDALLKTCNIALKPSQSQGDCSDSPHSSFKPSMLVFYTHHRPHLAHRDMEFFDKAREAGWDCVKIVTQKFTPMFPEDPGEEEVRATVHGWMLNRKCS
ncbi:putative methyltransferase-domain-containing protein [Lentinula detonsa]|uniref:Protein N-terminal and lysine N-methyltransferase EFM7 n=1 Tax=Lentinula detonsa TaxID=2804962 RepID=A0AA38PW20_9AGAR|nr:putative methyltransferase-domain-containing protein [Lentinula detonsa]